MIDTHCHLTSKGLCHRVDQVVQSARDAGVDHMICIGTDPDDARLALSFARKFGMVSCTVGLQPHDAHKWTDRVELVDAITEIASQPQVVALGEMGLDKYYADPPLADQQRVFEWQLQMAAECVGRISELPIVIHNRQATDLVIELIKSVGLPGSRFVFHCFTGTAEELDKILAFGAMVSFTGVITFKNSDALAAASDKVPLDRLMVETDSPYLTPEPHRKIKPNEPRFVVEVAGFIARRRDLSFEVMEKILDDNARRFFHL